MVSSLSVASVYDFKPSPYSSHSLLAAALPASGDGRRVLDVGCAGGYLAGILARRGFRVTGIERPGGSGSDFPAEVDLLEADLDRGLPPIEDRFSYILCADILEHLRDPARLLIELRERLAPGGRLVASLPNSGNLYFRLTILAGRFPQDDKGLFDRTHLHFYMWKGWADLLAAAGFRIESVRPTGIPVGLAFPRWQDTAAVRGLEALSYHAARAWRTLFAYQFVVVARP
ncbi:MAG: class I SAM-dependent methyltransferase [Bryobacteraceae bacterium]